MGLATQGPVRELVPLRRHVCLPGDPVLAVGAGAVVGVEGALRAKSAGEARVFVSEVCAAVERRAEAGHRNLASYAVAAPAARRYLGRPGDPVVATVLRRVGAQGYQCHLEGPYLAYLDALAFDGASKKSRPRLEEGEVIYAYVKGHQADRGLEHAAVGHRISSEGTCGALLDNPSEVQLSCTSAEVGLIPNDWTSGKSVFGPLRGGRVLTLPLTYVRALMTAPPVDSIPASHLVAAIGARVPFEICTGANGRVWVKGLPSEVDQTAEIRRTVAVCACLTEAQYDNTREEIDARVEAFFPASQSK